MTRILVCGGRYFGQDSQAHRDFLTHVLDGIHQETPITLLIQGGAEGADRLAWEWAMSHQIDTKTFFADWQRYGQSAGPIRNGQMLNEAPDRVIAFPGNTGTANMIKQAKEMGVPVTKYQPPEPSIDDNGIPSQYWWLKD